MSEIGRMSDGGLGAPDPGGGCWSAKAGSVPLKCGWRKDQSWPLALAHGLLKHRRIVRRRHFSIADLRPALQPPNGAITMLPSGLLCKYIQYVIRSSTRALAARRAGRYSVY